MSMMKLVLLEFLCDETTKQNYKIIFYCTKNDNSSTSTLDTKRVYLQTFSVHASPRYLNFILFRSYSVFFFRQ